MLRFAVPLNGLGISSQAVFPEFIFAKFSVSAFASLVVLRALSINWLAWVGFL
jgi:hypothetical protein